MRKVKPVGMSIPARNLVEDGYYLKPRLGYTYKNKSEPTKRTFPNIEVDQSNRGVHYSNPSVKLKPSINTEQGYGANRIDGGLPCVYGN